MFSSHLAWCYLVFTSLLLGSLIAASNRTETDLIEHLLRDYNPLARSRKDVGEPIEVSLTYLLHSLDEINEQEQYLRTFSWLFIEWHDDYLTWDPAEFSNVTSINLPSKRIWKPDIVVQNSLGSMYSEITNGEGTFQATLGSDGSIELVTAGPLKTHCPIVTTYFPYDSQSCEIVFDSWSYDARKVTLISAVLDLTAYRQNGAWDLVGNASKVERYLSAGRFFECAVYTLLLDRKPLYFITNIVIPCAALSLLVPLVFLLPPDAGEKISLSITLLLSFTLFLLMIAEHMPVTSDYSPILAVYAVCSMVLACSSLFCTLLVLRLHHHFRQTRVPVLLRKITNCCMCTPKKTANNRTDSAVQPILESNARAECGDRSHFTETEGERPLRSERMLCSLMKEAIDLLKEFHDLRSDEEARESIREEWLQLARILDKVFLVLFLTAEIVVIVIFLGILPRSGPGRAY